MGYVDHVVRRGLQHPSTVNLLKRAVSEGPNVEVPALGGTLITVSFFALVFFLSAVSYMLKEVVATLAMVETPSAAITVSPSSEPAAPAKNDKENLLETGPTITLVHAKPITSSIRGTNRHLIQNAGGWSRIRGVLVYYLYNLSFTIVAEIFDKIIPNIPGRLVLIAAISGALLCGLHASWTHKVIAMPTDKWFHKRIPALAEQKRLAFPAAVKAAMPYITIYIGQGFFILLGLDRVASESGKGYSGAQVTGIIVRWILLFAIMIACGLFICLPAVVTLIRVEASILPEDQDTIVPFDRTFDGKVVPKILGGTGCVGFLDAWRSFNWEARRRLLKLYAKILVVLTGLFLLVAHVLAFEVWFFMGPAAGKFIAQTRQQV